MSEQHEIIEVEPVENEVVSSVAMVETICRMSRFVQQMKRDEGLALKKTLEHVDETSFWKIPNRGEGVSVNIARTAFSNFGQCAILPNVTEVKNASGKDCWQITVMAIDMRTMSIQSSIGIVQKPERKPMEKDLAYDQRLFQAQLAFSGRLERNAIFKILPGHWKEQIKREFYAKQGAMPLEERVKILFAKFMEYGIQEKDIQSFTGVHKNKLTEPQFGELRGIYNAIYNGDLLPEEAFKKNGGEQSTPQVGRHKPQRPVTVTVEEPPEPVNTGKEAPPAPVNGGNGHDTEPLQQDGDTIEFPDRPNLSSITSRIRNGAFTKRQVLAAAESIGLDLFKELSKYDESQCNSILEKLLT